MIRLAMVQMLVEGGARNSNLARAEERITEAARGAAQGEGWETMWKGTP